MKNVVVFTGAGISVESGLPTFRGTDGLWEGYHVEDVATPEGWRKDRKLVLEFYNQRRKDCINAQPNAAHLMLAELENIFNVDIVTQNIDDLHERAGSTKVLHLHGEIRKSRSTMDPNMIYDLQGDTIKIGDKCEFGSQLRPHVVWFGEAVPNMHAASRLVANADWFIIVGTSLQVYPAANLLYDCGRKTKIVLIDPNAEKMDSPVTVNKIALPAVKGVEYLVKLMAK